MALRRQLTMGVDFGTTSSSAGVFDRGQVQLVYDSGQAAIPSVVHFPTHGEPVIGADAGRRATFSPRSSVSSIKRLLGRKLGDSIVRRHAALSPYTVAPSPGGKLTLGFDTGAHSVEQIVGLILADLREAAERRFGVSIRSVAISVPSIVGVDFERALVRAASTVRLKVVETIPEPVAGALGLGLHLSRQPRRLVLCDFGGGFFDVAVITCGNNRLDVIATAGDPGLGGDDFLDALVGGIATEEFGHTLFDAIAEAESYARLIKRLEPLMRRLSSDGQVRLRARDAYSAGGELRDVDRVISRAWAESRWSPLVERAISIVERTIRHVDLTPDEIDAVVLLGGISSMPMVRHRFSESFGQVLEIDPREAASAVVRGAVLRSSQFVAQRSRRQTRTRPPPIRAPDVPEVAEPNMASTARIEPIRL